jgi:threonine synthase
VPGIVFVPTGGGSAFVGAWRGFAAVGALPKLVAAQPAACAPIVAAHERGEPMITTPGATLAEGTRIGAPARTQQILDALNESGGWAAAISEEALVAALRELWAQGLYVEPTCAIAAAACRAYLERLATPPAAPPVVLLTGSGLKATETIGKLL